MNIINEESEMNITYDITGSRGVIASCQEFIPRLVANSRSHLNFAVSKSPPPDFHALKASDGAVFTK
jgi:hypothetical protein